MKTTYIKIVFFVCMLIMYTGCKKEDSLSNLNVSAVKTLYEPVNNKSIVLQASATASVYFEWEPALAENGSLTMYQVAFDTLGGDFSKPSYVITADNNGANTHATITHKQLNNIAALSGVGASQTGTLIWTIISSKGVNPKIAEVSNVLEIVRLAGFAEVPNSLYVSGEGSEVGTDITKAAVMKSTSYGVFEIYTKLTAGKTYYFTDANVGTSPRKFYTNDKAVLLEGETGSTVSTTGVYRINLDFSIGASTINQITKCELFFCPTNSFPFELNYVNDGVWTAKSKAINFKVESWGKDQRYKFKMTTTNGDVWWGAPASLDSAPTGVESYYYLVPAESDQWNNKFKFATEMDGALVDMSVIMSSTGSYTHTVTKVGMQ